MTLLAVLPMDVWRSSNAFVSAVQPPTSLDTVMKGAGIFYYSKTTVNVPQESFEFIILGLRTSLEYTLDGGAEGLSLSGCNALL
jgi:hypothetical protein